MIQRAYHQQFRNRHSFAGGFAIDMVIMINSTAPAGTRMAFAIDHGR